MYSNQHSLNNYFKNLARSSPCKTFKKIIIIFLMCWLLFFLLFFGGIIICRYIAMENTRAYCTGLWWMKLRAGYQWLHCIAFPSPARWECRQNSLMKRIPSVTWTLILKPFLPMYLLENPRKRISSTPGNYSHVHN